MPRLPRRMRTEVDMKRTVRTRLVRAAACAVALSALCMVSPSGAFALAASIPASPAVVTTAPAGQWALDFTLPTFGKSGCLVCHGDINLIVPSGMGDVSFWIDERAYDRSAHGRVVCTGCHVDFGYKAPHSNGDWRTVAKQACVNCHDKQFLDFQAGMHAARPGSDKSPDPKAGNKPLCGDCHGSHGIAVLKDNPAGKAALRGSALATCGKYGCHRDYWDNYSDYYHGAAYKAGAADAPACWDCHGAHTVIETSSTLAPTNERNLPATCGKGATGALVCHEGVEPSLMQYTKLIHKRDQVAAANPLLAFFESVRSLFRR
jgi:hypothetical protein